MAPPTIALAGRYRLVEPIGEHAHGRTWRGTDTALNRPVAIKMVEVKGQGPLERLAADFIERERGAAAVVSPFIASTYDVGAEDGVAFIVSELLGGPNLADLVAASGALDPERALTIAHGVAIGLADAHEAGIAHGNLGPTKVVLNGDVPKLVDIGLADRERGTAAASGSMADDLAGLGDLLLLLTGRSGRRSRRRPDDPVDALAAALRDRDPARRPSARNAARELQRLRDAHWAAALPSAATDAAVQVRESPLAWLVTFVVAAAATIVIMLALRQAGVI